MSCQARAPSRSCQPVGRQRHTAQYPIIEIHYPFHPLVGQKLQVLGFNRFYGETHSIVSLPDGTRTYIPLWMSESKASELSVTTHAAPR
jgi:hypothetical protein